MSNKDFDNNEIKENKDGMAPDQVDEEIHSETLEGQKREPQHLIINKETGKVINAKTGEEVQTIDIVTEDGMLGSVSASGRIVLCGANAYEEKYYFNPLFRKVPESIQKELRIICVLYTQNAGGVFTIEFEEDGTITMETNADEEDITYDEVSAGLLIGEIRRQRQDLFKALETYYKVIVLHHDISELLNEDETDDED
ncbi:hypothetical protein SAMN02745229_02806 [Butyrivibrio fibrisolvens DSM 3071]|uniref:Uncharacterized protein n=1 Tax=Butyrivibrio fibrisolvens DSM 3071 TaxID=1121131 RepID=A0A1M5ZXK5_BUTFI|nr:DUF6145 family protein [Butyrivibrio fibrisolvens]SHI28908.1 hypothetical protein SAMN02745229_02806 [Butyrivibrio fibrisolvens DSM 3071]